MTSGFGLARSVELISPTQPNQAWAESLYQIVIDHCLCCAGVDFEYTLYKWGCQNLSEILMKDGSPAGEMLWMFYLITILIITVIPSRELTYPTLGKENHLQNAILGGYVSSLEGIS